MSRDVESVTCWLLRRCSGGKVSKEIGAMVYCGDGSNQSGKGWLRTSIGDERYLDGSPACFVLAAAVEVGHHAEAAAAVLDEGADGGAPSPLRLLGRVLGREIEVLPQALLQPVHPSLSSLPQERRARRGREQREEMDGEFEFELWKGGTSEGSLEYKKEQPTPGEAWSADIF